MEANSSREEMQQDTSKKMATSREYLDLVILEASPSFPSSDTQKVSFGLGIQLGTHTPESPAWPPTLPAVIAQPRTPAGTLFMDTGALARCFPLHPCWSPPAGGAIGCSVVMHI